MKYLLGVATGVTVTALAVKYKDEIHTLCKSVCESDPIQEDKHCGCKFKRKKH